VPKYRDRTSGNDGVRPASWFFLGFFLGLVAIALVAAIMDLQGVD
jgi:hypothetical protein